MKKPIYMGLIAFINTYLLIFCRAIRFLYLWVKDNSIIDEYVVVIVLNEFAKKVR